MKNKFVVEYSLSQDAFHVQCVMEMISRNINTTLNGQKMDYLPIGVFDTNEQAHDFVSVFEKKIREVIKSNQN